MAKDYKIDTGICNDKIKVRLRSVTTGEYIAESEPIDLPTKYDATFKALLKGAAETLIADLGKEKPQQTLDRFSEELTTELV